MIDLQATIDWVRRASEGADGVLVELPGGLFSPLGPTSTNADLAVALPPDAVFLVAPDRLGVLHDVGATVRAAHAERIAIRALVLVATATLDASSTTNAAELALVTRETILGPVPRAPSAELADHPAVRDALALLPNA